MILPYFFTFAHILLCSFHNKHADKDAPARFLSCTSGEILAAAVLHRILWCLKGLTIVHWVEGSIFWLLLCVAAHSLHFWGSWIPSLLKTDAWILDRSDVDSG